MDYLKQQIQELQVELECNLKHSQNQELNQQKQEIEELILKLKDKQINSKEQLILLKNSLSKANYHLRRRIKNVEKIQYSDLYMFFQEQQYQKKNNIDLVDQLELTDIKYDSEMDELDITIDLLNITNKDLIKMSYNVFQKLGFIHSIQLDNAKLNRILEKIATEYNIIAYHNFTHAYSVFQMMGLCISKEKRIKEFPQIELFSVLMACISHDMNHRGVNNSYHINKQSNKSILYSEQSIMENMHSSKFFRIIQQDELNILSDMVKEQVPVFKEFFISSILATDMSKHNKLLSKFQKMNKCKQFIKQSSSLDSELLQILEKQQINLNNKNIRQLVANVLTHSCDIGNPALPFDSYMKWSYLVTQEFHEQTLKEECNKLPVTQMFQYKGELTFYKGQQFFSSCIVLPIWKEICAEFENLEFIVQNIQENLKELGWKVEKCQKK